MSDPRITCLVPTHNRRDFLRRWFRFYQEFPPGFAITVVDSSDPKCAAENAALVQAQPPALRARYLHLNLNFSSKCHEALRRTETPLVTMCADDDIIFPDAVRRSAEFLDAQPSYVSAQGRTAKIYPNRSWFAFQRLKGYSIEDDEPLARCRCLAENPFTNFYAVYRLETLRSNFGLVAANSDTSATALLGEIMLSQLSAIRGRIKVLPFMHLLIGRHARMGGVLNRRQVWTDAEHHYRLFKDCLVGELGQAGVARADADAHIGKHYGYFGDPVRPRRWRRRSLPEMLTYLVRSAWERGEDAGQADRVRHQRPLLPMDIAGSEAVWKAAVALIRRYPDGIPG